MGKFIYSKNNGEKLFLGKALTVSVLNQSVSSGTNFILGLYLVRMLSPVEFGLYGIGFAISLFYSGIGNALFLTQMVVRTPDKNPVDRLPYASRIFVLTVIFSLTSAFLAVAFLLFATNAFEPIGRYAVLGLAITSLSTTYLLKDFFIRHAYSVLKEKRALAVNISLAVTLFIVLAIQSIQASGLTASRAIVSVSIAQSIAMLFGFIITKLPFKNLSFSKILTDWKEIFKGGMWAVIAHIVITVRGQAYTIVVATLMGPASVARLNAARIFITPATMLMPALGQVFLPRIAKARAKDPADGYNMGVIFSAAMFGISVSYSIVILILFPSIVHNVIGPKYHSLFWLVFGWSIYNCLSSLRSGQEMTLMAYKLFRPQATIHAFGAVTALVTVYLFFLYYGEVGSIYGLFASEVLVLLLMWRMTRAGQKEAI